ncbi:MAG: tol-pal system protein YbgF [Desulforegulaceae bacterium]|nr:tol-pal system protein YbgF [Desulforegulaceae bacterium]
MRNKSFLKVFTQDFKPGILIPIVLVLFFITGCASKNSSKTNQSPVELKLIDERMTAVEEKIDKLYSRLSIIQFMVDNHEQMIKVTPSSEKTSEDKNLSVESLKPEETYLSPQKLYSRGIDFLKKKDYQNAIKTFDEFLDKYPNETLADNALYWKGESFYAQSYYDKSAEIFELVTTTYPDGTKCPDAMLKAGYSYLKLGNNKKAKESLQKVIKTWPFSNAAPKAQAKLKEIL